MPENQNLEPNERALLDMELDSDFFSDNDDANQEDFASQFDEPLNPNASIDDDAGNGLPDGSADSDDDQMDDFKFDDAMAQEEAKELAELNAKMGTNFKSRNDLEAALKNIDKVDNTKEIDEAKSYVNFYDKLLNATNYPDAEIVREDKKIEAIRSGKNINDSDVIEQIDYEVNQLEESGALSYVARSVRQTLQSARNEKAKIISNHEESITLTATQKEAKFKQDIQEGISDIFKEGSFLGVKPTKEVLLDVYKNVSKNKHIEHLKLNPKDAVEFELFKRYRPIIEKNLGKPNYEAGVKRTLQELGMSYSKQTGTPATDNSKDRNTDELNYLQKFAK